MFLAVTFRMNFLSNILREEGGFEYKKAIVDSIVILIRDIPEAKESGLLHLCEFIEDCEFTYLSTQVAFLIIHKIAAFIDAVMLFSPSNFVSCYFIHLIRYSTFWGLKAQRPQIPANTYAISTTVCILRMLLSGLLL
jgi:hypothetical protein